MFHPLARSENILCEVDPFVPIDTDSRVLLRSYHGDPDIFSHTLFPTTNMQKSPQLPITIHLAAFEAMGTITELILTLNHLLVTAVFRRIRVILAQPPPPPKIVPKDRHDDFDEDESGENDGWAEFSLDGYYTGIPTRLRTDPSLFTWYSLLSPNRAHIGHSLSSTQAQPFYLLFRCQRT
ncbi:hypothetical protein SISNIDRAFT_487031 [Sistotremastrum niveocremeum HHB9708]|uniref:Uncharacterized protein n=1 Tax=Sistotremastrum niveocremeum HHB9708 TaxID=1314777 RepID=A0A164SQW5_9AGAM|nr:hypothetical protein SISNIDRAFT_487031 [Sistotremastrum niveocremeum HHB9708]